MVVSDDPLTGRVCPSENDDGHRSRSLVIQTPLSTSSSLLAELADMVIPARNLLLKVILVLAEMKWNGAQFDGALPSTLKAAPQVGDILKYVGWHDRNWRG
jgi:hypothetical protein